MSDIDGRTYAKEYRYGIGAEILLRMNECDDLPLPSIYRVSKVMMEYFKTMDYAKELKKMEYKWRPTIDYWIERFPEIRGRLRKDGHFLEYHHFEGSISGMWRFCSKKEYEKTLNRQYLEIVTRTATYNDKLDDGERKWNLQLPHARLAQIESKE